MQENSINIWSTGYDYGTFWHIDKDFSIEEEPWKKIKKDICKLRWTLT